MQHSIPVSALAHFIVVHFIKKLPPGLPNRGADGAPKSSSNGGEEVQRVSAQCAKSHARTSEHLLEAARITSLGQTYRSAQIIDSLIVPALVEDGATEAEGREYGIALMGYLFGKEVKLDESQADATAEDAAAQTGEVEETKPTKGKGAKAKAKKAATPDPKKNPAKTQPLVLGKIEVEAMITLAKQARAEGITPEHVRAGKLGSLTEPLEAVKSCAGLDALLHGRMSTGSIISTINACVFASAWISTHPMQSAADFWTTQEQFQKPGDNGAAHNGFATITEGVFYGNVVFDLRQMAENFGGTEHIRPVINAYLETIYELDPSAKRGGTGAGATIEEMVIEIGNAQPQTALGFYADNPEYRPADAAARLRDSLRQRRENAPRPKLAQREILCLTEGPKSFFDDVLAAVGLPVAA